jgi:hypothetical protein
LPLDLDDIPYQPFCRLFVHTEETFINGGIDDATDAGRRDDR